MQVKERILAFQALLKERNVDAYVVPTADFHESEYVGDYFKVRAFLSGFTGSAGVLVVTPAEAALWTDGRYFIAAAAQLAGSGVTLMKMGEEGVPTIEQYLVKVVPDGGVLGFDGRVVNTSLARGFAKAFADAKKEVMISAKADLVDLIWKERPAISTEPAYRLALRYSGKSTADKLAGLREAMAQKGADAHLLTTLDDIAWLFNLRGNDVAHCPVVLAFSLITPNEAKLFLHEQVLSPQIKEELAGEGVTVLPYEGIYDAAAQLPASSRVLLDVDKVNFAITSRIPKGAVLLEEMNPTTTMKAVKNPTEIENTIQAHIYDGVAFTKFMYWVKNRYREMEITEISASDYLEARRREQPDNLGLSFHTIAGFGANAAMMHYAATPETDTRVTDGGLLLVDSGGHYYTGTTDITRTMVFGEISPEMKKHFTAVVRSCLRLSGVRFLQGCCGLNLDVLARGPIWDMELDYKCGTGHGVGHLLNVHEGPNGFRWRIVPERKDSAPFEEGMITTDEPGIYLEGQYGIRIENELVCRKGVKNEYGQFMYFDIITIAPIDLDGVDPTQMEQAEIDMLNRYHADVYQKLSPYLTAEEAAWLKRYTRPISR